MKKTDNRFKIAFLSYVHAHDKRSYSGSLYYMGKALEQHCGEVIYLERILSWKKRYLGRIMHGAAKRILKKSIIHARLLFVAKEHARIAAHRLAGQHFDVIVAP